MSAATKEHVTACASPEQFKGQAADWTPKKWKWGMRCILMSHWVPLGAHEVLRNSHRICRYLRGCCLKPASAPFQNRQSAGIIPRRSAHVPMR